MNQTTTRDPSRLTPLITICLLLAMENYAVSMPKGGSASSLGIMRALSKICVLVLDESRCEAGEIQVLVTDAAGRPLASGIVTCSSGSKALTDESGFATFSDLPLGNYAVTVTAPERLKLGKARQSLSLTTESPTARVSLDLRSGEWIEGELLNPMGANVPRMYLEATSDTDREAVVIDSDGHFSFQSTPGEVYSLFVGMFPEDAGPFWTYPSLDVPSGTRGVELRYGVGGSITATPLAPDGSPSDGNWVVCHDLFDPVAESWSGDYEGQVVVNNIHPATYSLLIESVDGLMAIKCAAVKPETQAKLGRIKLEVTGTVKLPVIPGEHVVVLHEGHWIQHDAPSELKLPPGHYSLGIDEGSRLHRLTGFTVESGVEIDLSGVKR